ncbi:hypothetical protein RPB_1533 [Rhodopseudomonas palustris HaA2]|uniref:Uncharacterized protein n=1 Tax=Rhodopseudomonas palustris (strain HaA2) TaxID=316058 RepID=Q2IZW7_RHOP2|nr:hypothetical protein [Rhodopseudomonas palustris]ABD06243.1 hypothetical protein RPB_1533 [Rhodopseudomonas palustris HaA2]
MIDVKKDTESALRDAAEVTAELVLNGYVEKWVEGAIFPSEMAFFLAKCMVEGVTTVVESGRQDGYSTEILGDWASRDGRRIISIDLEDDAARAAACRRRLSPWPIELIKGSAYEQFGRWTKRTPDGPVGFLADGPKGWPAISMMAAATTDRVRVVALHNLTIGSGERALFEQIGGKQAFYEHAIVAPGPRWTELRNREMNFASAADAQRSLDVSSLGVLSLDADRRGMFRGLWRPEFGLHQPAAVRTLWNLGLAVASTKLYGLSFRLLGR